MEIVLKGIFDPHINSEGCLSLMINNPDILDSVGYDLRLIKFTKQVTENLEGDET